MLKVGIVGATGYVGRELIQLLHRHQGVEITSLSARRDKEQPICEEFPQFRGEIELICTSLKEPAGIADLFDLVFLALPHTVSMKTADEFLRLNKSVIDLSADFRLEQASIYEEWYKEKHLCPHLLLEAVYGLPEIYREQIKKARLVANPGCYPTSAILGLAPLLNRSVDIDSIIIDAKSGISGAGKTPSVKNHFPERNESLCAYNAGTHRHIPEIEQELSKLAKKEIKINFVPHLIPMNRGMLSTIYLKLNGNLSLEELYLCYREFYASAPFIRIVEQLPETKDVVFTNYCDIALRQDIRTGYIVIISVIDNLMKGAAGQAVQDMNIMYGFDEKMGLN